MRSTLSRSERELVARAHEWRTSTLLATCDRVEPWEHGTVFLATRYPSYYDLNVVRVSEPSPMRVAALTEFADQALAGLEHRLIEFDHAEAGEPLRPEFERQGWRALRLLWMLYCGKRPDGPEAHVEELPFEGVRDLRVHWHHEDFPGQDPSVFHAQAQEVALQRGARILTALEDGTPIAFAQLEHREPDAEVTEVYVRRDRRGAGLGTAVTRAAIAAAGPVRDLWISADDEGAAKRLYQRLGFRPIATTMQFLLPSTSRHSG